MPSAPGVVCVMLVYDLGVIVVVVARLLLVGLVCGECGSLLLMLERGGG